MNRVRYKAAVGGAGRVVVARLLPGTDLIEGTEEICNRYKIKYAVISCAIGSLKKTSFRYVVPKPELKTGAGYDEPPDIKGPVELLGATGVITETEDKKINVHLHGAICDQKGVLHGGHFDKGENLALYTIELVIAEVEKIEMPRKYDTEVDAPQLWPVFQGIVERPKEFRVNKAGRN